TQLQNSADLNSYPDRNPNPVLTLDKRGELIYANQAAQRILYKKKGRPLSPKYPGKFLHTSSKAIRSKKNQKLVCEVNDSHYSFSFCLRPTEEIVDVYGVDISEEVKHQTYFTVISAFSTALLKAETEEDTARIITREAISRLSFVDCVVYLVDLKDGMLKQIAAHGPKNPESLGNTILNPISLSFDEGIVGVAATKKKTILVDDVTKESRYVLDDEQRLSELAVPLIAGDEVIGVIDSEHPERNYYSKEDAKILEAIASIAASKIQHIRSIKKNKLTEAKFQSFVENAFGGLYIHRDNKFEYVNEQFCEITGYSSEELLNPDFNIQSLIVSADQRAIRAMKARSTGDESPKSYQLEMITKKRQIRQLAVNTCILEDEEGQVTLGIAVDITETIESRHKLEGVIASLGKKTDELNEFAHIASHNLRAPVTNLIGLLEYYNMEDPSDPMNRIIMEKLSKTVEQLTLTLEDMHDVLKIRAQQEFEIKKVNLNNLVEGIKSQLSEKIRQAKFRVETNFEVDVVNYEQSHLKNLFLNLITNAIKYKREGVDPHIRIHSAVSENHVIIVFQDNGIGIDLDKHGKDVFGMYKRFHTNPDSRGLGLYLIKKQLSALGSSISVTSTLGQGTRFTVKLIKK
ncbi:MAG: ATP-binding protein, partial [Cryomorphaceae bacterium]